MIHLHQHYTPMRGLWWGKGWEFIAIKPLLWHGYSTGRMVMRRRHRNVIA